jgi:hypothetical protein
MPIRFACLSILLIVLSGCANDATPRASPAPSPRKAEQATVTRTPQPRLQHAPRCSAGDLVAHFRPEGDGAGGHVIALLDFRNVGSSRCVLSGYPRRVTLSEPGHRPVTATRGSFFPVAPSEPMEHGGVTTVGLETDTTCPARPGGGPPGPVYHEVTIALPGGVVRVTDPRGLDLGCGAHLTEFTVWQ